MDDFEKFDYFVKNLAELSAFLTRLKWEKYEAVSGERMLNFLREADENFKKTASRSLPNADLQLNKEDTLNISTPPKGEEMIKLKHGQGCITIRLRHNKNGTVYKIYVGRYYDELGKQRSVYAKTQKECVKLLKQARPAGNNVNPHRYLTLKEWMLTWYNDFKKQTLRPSSQHAYEALMEKHIFPQLGKTKLIALTVEQTQHFLNGISAGNTRKKVNLVLSACLKKAVLLKKLSFNVCDAVELPKFKAQKRRPLEYSEQNKILSVGNKYSQAFFFLCATGLRVGEFLALTEDDFYFDQHFFKVDKALSQGILGEPKSETSNRIVYFCDTLFENFDIKLLGTFTYNSLKLGFKRLLKALGIKGISLHCTRHTFATICHSLSLNDKILQTLLGHSTMAMTQDVYTHLLKKGSSKIRDYLQDFCVLVRELN